MRRHPIFFLRHGETESNAAGRMQGHLDSNLTAKGKSQAHTVATVLSRATDGASTAVVTSSLGRAVQTADIICRILRTPTNLRRADDRLKEMTWGAWDGFTLPEIRARWPQEWHARQADRWYCPPPGGESYAMLMDRVAPAFQEILSDDRPIIVIAHGVVGRIIRGLHLRLDPTTLMNLDEPQGVVMRLDAGGITALAP